MGPAEAETCGDLRGWEDVSGATEGWVDTKLMGTIACGAGVLSSTTGERERFLPEELRDVEASARAAEWANPPKGARNTGCGLE